MEIPETYYAQSSDISIAYQIVGDGPFDVVFVPSFSHVELCWTMANHHGEIPRRLSSFGRLIVFDKRGMGMSDRVGRQSLETRMDDVRAVMDAAGSTRAALFGILDGASIALQFAATYPERTSALVLLTAILRVRWAPDYPWGLKDDELQALTDGLSLLFFGSRSAAYEAARAFRGREPSDEDVKTDMEYLRRSAATPSTWQAYLDVVRETDVRSALSAIRVPTLFIHGTEAVGYRFESAQWATEQIPGARLLALPGESMVPAGVALARALAETELFLCEAWEAGAWDEPEPDRVLATILFTDIVGSSERAVELGDRAWRELLTRHHELVRRQLTRFRGREVDTAGDGFLASFDIPARAVRCAQAVVEGVHALGSTFALACTQANASFSTARSPGSPFTRAPALPHRHMLARCLSRAPSRTSWPAPVSSSRKEAFMS
jgi:pimeloyl-ACP methyl ester carboxylesterase